MCLSVDPLLNSFVSGDRKQHSTLHGSWLADQYVKGISGDQPFFLRESSIKVKEHCQNVCT